MDDLLSGLTPPEPAHSQHCEWCLAFSGRTKKGRACCDLRELASMPKEQRQQVYISVMNDGPDVLEALKRAVTGEYKRRMAHVQGIHQAGIAAAKAALARPRI
jgi:hypothetical protein